MPIQLVLNANEKNGHKPVKIFTDEVDQQALQQLRNIAACHLFMVTLRQCPMFMSVLVQPLAR
jgi:adenosine/AMP kinase